MTENIEKIEDLLKFYLEEASINKKDPNEDESDQLNELFAAISKAQAEMEIVKNTSLNPFFRSRYASFAALKKAATKPLANHNLCVIQKVLTNDNNQMHLLTILGHSSGQFIVSKMPISPLKSDIQSIGSYITYLKRYEYAAIVGIASSDEDDDGEAAMKENRGNTATNYRKEKISKTQLAMLSEELKDHDKLLQDILKAYEIKKLSDIPEKHVEKCLERIKEIKQQKDDE